jgi:hypothetical protein
MDLCSMGLCSMGLWRARATRQDANHRAGAVLRRAAAAASLLAVLKLAMQQWLA